MRNELTDGIANNFCRQIELNHTLKVLDLSHNSLAKGFLRRFLQALENVQSLESLSLANNKFGPECDELFHLLIRGGASIRYLNLSFNSLKDQSLSQIADAMVLNKSIIWL
jgi:Ran GTPase-activating protein (RanGAP) involved in mRNA processing and transport